MPRAVVMLVSVSAGVLLWAQAAGGAVFKPARLPLTLALPPGWSATTPESGARFAASGAGGRLQISVGVASGTFGQFVASEKATAKSFYTEQDRSARLSSRIVALPSGRALETSVALDYHGTPLGITLYVIQHDGASYALSFVTGASATATEQSSFAACARSIRFIR